MSSPVSGCRGLVHYLITRRETRGLEVPHILLGCGAEVLPVFSSAEAATRFLSSQVLGEGWYVREYSTGELVSLLFGLYGRAGRVLHNPVPTALSGEGALASVMSRDRFIESLIGG